MILTLFYFVPAGFTREYNSHDTRSDSCIKQTRASDIQIRTSEALAFQPYPAFVCWERFLYYIFTVIMSKA